MARIEFRGLGHSYRAGASEEEYALKPMDLTWDDGGAYALLGPSGCGKTTLLNIISGLVTPSHGAVLFDGKDVTRLATEQRNIAQVFQFPVIYDTMTVFDNLAFPLRNRGVAETEVRSRVGQVAEMLELTSDLKHRASGLAADAKQKISLGRGLVRKDVAAILFDEPLTVIDPHLKWKLRRKLKQIHKEFKLTLIYVTHDQTEALTFADKVVVMYEGRVVQSGSPQQLFEAPAHVFVGHFIGSPGMNLLPCTLNGEGVALGSSHVRVDPNAVAKARAGSGQLQLGIRPEFVKLSNTQVEGSVEAQVAAIENRGDAVIVDLKLGEHTLKAKLEETHHLPEGRVWIGFPAEWTRLYQNGIAL